MMTKCCLFVVVFLKEKKKNSYLWELIPIFESLLVPEKKENLFYKKAAW